MNDVGDTGRRHACIFVSRRKLNPINIDSQLEQRAIKSSPKIRVSMLRNSPIFLCCVSFCAFEV